MFKMIKRAIITRVLDKRKKGQVFDLEAADNYELPSDAPGTFNNSHYFFLTDLSGQDCLYFRLAKRGGDVADELWLVYRNAAGEIYMAASDRIAKGAYMPARVECAEVGKTMRFFFDGEVVKAKQTAKGYMPDGDGKKLKMKIDGRFEGESECFEFSYHLSSKPMARAMSKEKIDQEKLKEFGENHQIHYEQGGKGYASIELDGKKTSMDKLPAFRDHSFGKRDWNYFDRYAWIMCLLENGDFIHTSLIRYPVLKHLQAGFYIPSGGKAVSILECTPVEKIPVPEYGNAPDSLEIDVKYVDGAKKNMKTKLDFVCPFYFDDEFNVNEGLSEFTVNGVRGRGITEFSFNKDRTRWGI